MVVVACAFTSFSQEAQAQSFLKALKDKAVEKVKDKVSNKVEDKVGEATDNVLDGKVKGKNKKGSKNDADDTAFKNDKATTTNDFVRGSVVLFEDDFSKDPVGEYPAKWEVLSGTVDIFKKSGKNAADIGEGIMRPFVKPDPEKYLGDEWTLEYEYYGYWGDDRCNDIETEFVVSGDEEKNFIFFISENGWHVRGSIEAQNRDLPVYTKWNTLQFSYNKGAFKVYLNGKRIVNRNRVVQPSHFKVKGSKSDDEGTYIRNVKLCLGAKEKYEQQSTDIDRAMAETGKFVTNNILFETGKADLKTESMIEIIKVADYMKKNPKVRFEVQGHCDNQGSDKVNDPLSQKRSEAIVSALVKLGVDEFNLKAVGKGSHEPVADNKTEEGRAKNRRVEFIKR